MAAALHYEHPYHASLCPHHVLHVGQPALRQYTRHPQNQAWPPVTPLHERNGLILPSPIISRITASSHVLTIILFSICTGWEIRWDDHLAFSGLGAQYAKCWGTMLTYTPLRVLRIPYPFAKVGIPALRHENRKGFLIYKSCPISSATHH